MGSRERIEPPGGRHALVDGIPFSLPVDSRDTPALMAAFPISAERAAELIPGKEVHPFRLGGDVGLLVVTVVNYRDHRHRVATSSSRSRSPAPTGPPGAARCSRPAGGRYGTGQFVVDLPVSTEVSVKGGKGIWGMPKHQANLDFVISKRSSGASTTSTASCAADRGRPAPRWTGLPVSTAGVNYCAFRGHAEQVVGLLPGPRPGSICHSCARRGW